MRALGPEPAARGRGGRWAMHSRAVLVVAVGLVLVAGCGGSGKAPYRIAVLADCYGFAGNLHDSVLAAAELPLLQRGGKLLGKTPSDGVEGARVAGRPVGPLARCVHRPPQGLY